MDKIFLSKKAKQLRSNWRKRAKKYNCDLSTVPETSVIFNFLKDVVNDGKLSCYLTGNLLDMKDVEFDHKISVSRGGSFNLKNVGPTSRKLNNIKGEMTDKEFKQLLKLVSKWGDKGAYIMHRLSRSNVVFGRKG